MNPIKITITQEELTNTNDIWYVYNKMVKAGIPMKFKESEPYGYKLFSVGANSGYLERENDLSNGSIYYTWYPRTELQMFGDAVIKWATPTKMENKWQRDLTKLSEKSPEL